MNFKKRLATILLIISTTFIFISLFGNMDFNLQGFEFRIFLQIFDHGLSEIIIPPVGKISAKTHKTPLKIGITLESVDMDFLRQIFEKPMAKNEIIEDAKERIYKVIKIFVVRLLFLSFVGGAFAMLLLHRKRPISYLRGGVTGLIIISTLLLGTYYTYDVNKFSNPSYKGVLKAAPWMMGLAEQALVKVEVLGDKLEITAQNLYRLFEKIDYLDPLGQEGIIKILHVSDIHNNPAAYRFIQQVAVSFGVDMIIDTGDITDYGSPLEVNLIKRIENFTVPYIFVAGNHDSPDIIKAMKSLKNVKVLGGKVEEIQWLVIAGIHDPASVSADMSPPSREAISEKINELAALINDKNVNIIIVHNPRIAQKFVGKATLVLHGHDHQMKVKKEGHSVIVDAGTSGAAGIRGLQTTKETPYTVAVIHLNKFKDNWDVQAVDTISVSNLQSGFTLQRHVFKDFTEY